MVNIKLQIKKLIQNKVSSVFVLIILVLITYGNTLQNNFAWDDRDFIVNWEDIRDIKNLPEILSGAVPVNHTGVYRPVRGIIYIFSYKLWGQNPLGYHLQAMITYTITVILVYLIICHITKNNIFGFIGASIFTVHPIHTEAISFITASFDSFGVIFFFLSFYLYIISNINKQHRIASQIGSLIYAFLAFFTYEMTLILPFLIMLYDYCFQNLSLKNIFTKFKIYINYFFVLLFYVLIRFFILQLENRGDLMGGGYKLISTEARLATFEIIIQYAKWLVYPVNLSVSHQVPTGFINFIINSLNRFNLEISDLIAISHLYIFLPIIFVIILIFITFKVFKKNRVIIFCITWFLVSLIPVLNIFEQGAIRAERFLYIPSFGFSFLVAYLFCQVYKKMYIKKIILSTLIIFYLLIIIYYSVTTFTRNEDWRDEESIWISYISLNPDSTYANSALGFLYLKQEKTDKAIIFLKKALENDEENPKIHYNLALAYEKKNQTELAILEYQKTIKYQPEYILSYIKLGDLYEKQNKTDSAISQYLIASSLDPNQAFMHHNLGTLYDKIDKSTEALREYQKAVKVNPKYAESYNNMGIIYGKRGEITYAIRSFKKALEINPNNFKAHFNLAYIYEKNNDYKSAIEHYKKGLTINPAEKSVEIRLNNILELNDY